MNVKQIICMASLLIFSLTAEARVSDRYSVAEGWRVTCELLSQYRNYTCTGIPKPTVIFVNLPGKFGKYPGGGIIYIRVGMSEELRLDTLVHEMVHYIHDVKKIVAIPGPSREVCKSEAEAYELTSLIGPNNSRWHARWYRLYPKCTGEEKLTHSGELK
jgi:hypothetical protein